MGKLIVIEGIDASGKSTIVHLIQEILAKNNIQSYIATKKNPRTGDPETDTYLNLLGQIVWANNSNSKPWLFLTDDQWILQIVLWYSVLSSVYIPKLCSAYDYVLVDGWFYKMYARFLHGRNPDFLESIFPSIDIADYVFLLDVDPESCWKRRNGAFRPTEISYYRSQITDPHRSFILYQKLIFGTLREMAEDRGWNIVSNPDDAPYKSAYSIASQILLYNSKEKPIE